MQPADQQYWTSPPPAAPAGPRARTWLIVLTAFLVELVAIAAACNQGLSDDVQKFYFRHQTDFVGQLARASQVYQWRVSAKAGSPHHLVLSEFALLATLFVLTAACVFALARGAVTFGRIFVGTWLAVIVATQVGAVVQNLVVDVNLGGTGRFTYAMFAGPTAYHFVAGLGLGLLVALIAGLVAVASRRPAVVAAGPERFDSPSGGLPATPFGSPPAAGSGGAPAPPERWTDRQEDRFATAQFPAYAPPPPSVFAPPPPPAQTPAASPLAQAPTQFVPREQPAAPAKSAEPVPPPASPPDPTAPASTPASDATTHIPRTQPPPPPPAKAAPPTTDDPNQTTILPRSNFPRPPDDEELGHQPE